LFADHGKGIYYIGSVEVDMSSQQREARMELRLTDGDGSTSSRTTYFVYEDGEWRHRFDQEENDLFMPGASYEEFVATRR
jgi:hypothetical protein